MPRILPSPPACRHLLLLLLLALPLLSACARDARNRELARVAKDWCISFRAVQVMPVFPLTADLKPGDVFLTTTPLGAEVDLYRSSGFLPLDTLLARLPTEDLTPSGAPAAFPTVSIQVARSANLALAFPVKGVPVAASFAGSQAASAILELTDVRTEAIPADVLHQRLQRWARQRASLLAPYADDPARPVYLRVVHRVYRAAGVNVTLGFTGASAQALRAGIATPGGLPSGSAEFGTADRSVVALSDTFDTPLVVGYLASDVLILPAGTLSSPMPTLQRIAQGREVAATSLDSAGLITSWYTQDEAVRVPTLLVWIRSNVPDPPDLTDFLIEDQHEPDRQRALRALRIVR